METRIRLILEEEQLTSAEFADRIGVQRPTVSHVLSGRNKPGYTFLQKILASFPSVNARWLLLGEGEMYGDNSQQHNSGNLFAADKVVVQQPEPRDEVAETISPQPSQNQAIEKGEDEVKSQRKVEKILLFYTDKTFDEYLPG